MGKLVAIVAFVAIGCGRLIAQYAQKPNIERSGSHLVIRCNDPRPLQQAIWALNEQFHWKVNYEDAAYEANEVKDIAVPQWRQQHPGGIGLLVPSGGEFVAELDLKDDEYAVLSSLVEQYNKTANPGIFHVAKMSKEQYAVVGISRASQSSTSEGAMDVKVYLEDKKVTFGDVLQYLINNCGSASGTAMTMGTVPPNDLTRVITPYTGGNASCREQLLRMEDALGKTYVYEILYDPGNKIYVWNVGPSPSVL